tara:strand:- start:133 stop:243 length:111 start_codon:yes stop_codon:yes gene_type:complete
MFEFRDGDPISHDDLIDFHSFRDNDEDLANQLDALT